jgi:hypothetical protein
VRHRSADATVSTESRCVQRALLDGEAPPNNMAVIPEWITAMHVGHFLNVSMKSQGVIRF